MATVQELQASLDAVNALVDDVQARLDIIQSDLDSIDVDDPNAMDQFNQIVAQRDEVSNIWNSNTLYTQLANSYNSSPPEVQEALSIQFDALVAKASNMVSFARNQKTVSIPAKKKEIEDALANEDNENGTEPGGDNLVDPPPDDGQPINPNPGAGPGPTPPPPNEIPGRRPKNPLGYFSSYTYQISLYMVSPEARDAFILSGRRNIFASAGGRGVIIIAQSGGIKQENRSPKLPYDYYIDNLKMITATNPKSTGSGVNVTQQITFNIIEPYGFSFTKKLKEAQTQLQQESTSSTYKKITNATKQFYVLGIRFLGYDENGNIMTGDKMYNNTILDPGYSQSTGNGLFERFFDVSMVSFSFKINGKTTIYNLEMAVTEEGEGLGIKRGLLETNAQLEGNTVGKVLDELINKLNRDQDELVNQKPQKVRYANKYSINWSAPDAEFIRKASTVLPEDKYKGKWGTSPATNSSDSNSAIGEKVAPNNTVRITQFNRNMPIVQIIQDVIKYSTYLRDSLKLTYDSKLEFNTEDPSDNENKPDTSQPARWVNISTELTEAKWDDLRNDWAYNISYIIRPYEAPSSTSSYANKRSNYPGPFKRYDYWYTGLNNEILNYEQVINNSYYQAVFDPAVNTTGAGSGGEQQTTQQPNQPVNQSKTNSQDKGAQALNNYVNSLTDTTDSFMRVNITIIGDPDYLVQTSESSFAISENYRKYYGTDGYTINPNTSQFYIEVNFYEAIDYDLSKGYMSINDKIQFYKEPVTVKDPNGNPIQGVNFMPIEIQHTFSNGKFTQVLTCNQDSFGDPAVPVDKT